MADTLISLRSSIDRLRRQLAAAPGGPAGSVAWPDITGKPTTFPPSGHSHPATEISGQKTASFISDFAEAVDDRVAALLVQGGIVTVTYDDVGNILTIAATGGGSGSSSAMAWVI
jgi:hypothetical protein